MSSAWLRSEFEIPVAGFNAWTQGHTQMPLVDLVSALSATQDTSADKLKRGATALARHLAKVSTQGLIARGALNETAVPKDAWDVAEEKTAAFKDRLAFPAGANTVKANTNTRIGVSREAPV